MEAATVKHHSAAALRGPTPLLRLAGDEKLVELTRRGHPAAFEALVARYQARLLAFCRHMVSSREDAEDVLQEVFAASFNAMIADDRPINVRPWLYRIARNRSLNHLRRTQAVGVDSMDIHVAEHGTTTAEKVHRREDFRLLVADVQTLPETQRTALLLREIDALSYEQISEAMDTTVPAVKSLLVRARVSLAEAAEARTMTCDEVREELGAVAEGLRQRSTPPVRRHVRQCDRCSGFRRQLRDTNKALAAVFPVGPLLFMKKALLAHLGTTASAGGAAATTATAGGAAGGASALSAGVTAVATKTAAGLAAAAIVTAGAVEVQHAQRPHHIARAVAAAPAAPVQPIAPVVVASRPQTISKPKSEVSAKPARAEKPEKTAAVTTPAVVPVPPVVATDPEVTTTTPSGPPTEGSDTSALPPQQPGTTESGGIVAPEEPPASAGPAPELQPQPEPQAQAQSQPAPEQAAAPGPQAGAASAAPTQ